jgi:hypothetical protein
MRCLTNASSRLIWKRVHLESNFHSTDHQLGRGAFLRWNNVRKQKIYVQQNGFGICPLSQENVSQTRLSCKASFWLGKTVTSKSIKQNHCRLEIYGTKISKMSLQFWVSSSSFSFTYLHHYMTQQSYNTCYCYLIVRWQVSNKMFGIN